MALVETNDSIGLRERKKAATQIALQETALRLFCERGFSAVSVDEIATAAGVSRSTFFRYFGSKEAVLFDEIDETGDLFLKHLNSRPLSESPWDAYGRALIATAEARADGPTHDRSVMRDYLLRQDPALVGRRIATMQSWAEILARVFARREGREEPTMKDRLAATTCLAVSEEVGRIWREEGSEATPDAIREAFALLRSF